MKDNKDYLHLYLGCELETNIPGPYLHPYGCVSINVLDVDTFQDVLYALDKKEQDQKGGFNDSDHIYCKLLLRPLSDMTEEEAVEYARVYTGRSIISASIKDGQINFRFYEGDVIQNGCIDIGWGNAETFHYLLSKGFDLFGLIEAGLAIDKTTVTANP